MRYVFFFTCFLTSLLEMERERETKGGGLGRHCTFARVKCLQLVFRGCATNQRAKKWLSRRFSAIWTDNFVSSARLCHGVKTIQEVCHPNSDGRTKTCQNNDLCVSTTQTCVQLTWDDPLNATETSLVDRVSLASVTFSDFSFRIEEIDEAGD